MFLKEPKSSGILVVRTDSIGDYVLFRNFLHEFKQSTKFQNKKITLLGNIVWQEMAEKFDSNVIDHFIWIDQKQMQSSKSYRLKLLFELMKYKFEYLISPTYSREFAGLDSLVNVINANVKIGSIGDVLNTKLIQNKFDDIYTQLIPAKADIIFEFERNREFVENLLAIKSTCKLEIILDNHIELKFKNYVVLFVGASAEYRRWNLANFMELANWIHDKFALKVLLCGTVNDVSENDIIYESEFVINLIGKTELVELLEILAQAKFVVSNETCIPHMCVALGVHVFVLYNGMLLGRFLPYPLELTNKSHPIYHPQIEMDIATYAKISNQIGYISKLDINDITVTQVKENIMRVIIQNKITQKLDNNYVENVILYGKIDSSSKNNVDSIY